MRKIVVVGSSNTDLVVKTPHFPKLGETIIGGDFNTFAGGKGANQAVAASRLGADVSFIAKVGKDDFGLQAIKGLEKETINTDFVFEDELHPTGVAMIIVDGNGENVIVVSPGANNQLAPIDIDTAIEVFKNTDFILIQLESPIKTVSHVLELGSKLGKKVILNPAPAQLLKDSLYSKMFLITPNETEAALLTNIKIIDIESASKAADVLLNKGVLNVIITLGEKGAFFKNSETAFLVPTTKVKVVDTTGAGDIFNGALTVALTEGKDWKEAIKFANKAGAIGVGRLGAQASIPFRNELQ